MIKKEFDQQAKIYLVKAHNYLLEEQTGYLNFKRTDCSFCHKIKTMYHPNDEGGSLSKIYILITDFSFKK